MAQPASNVMTLSRLILNDVFKDFDDSHRWARNLLEPFVRPAAQRFAEIAAHFDEMVAHVGFREGMRQIISNFASEIKPAGCELIPKDGPLLLVSNHPGACDSLAIAASLPRDDLKIVAAGFNLLRELPNASRHLIFTDARKQTVENFSVVRAAIRHLQSGGTVLIFPSGRVDPDPALLPGAMDALATWSPSIELLMRKVPDTRAQIIIVSGVLAPVFIHNPLVKLWRGLGSPQGVAGVMQIISQLLLRGSVRVRPNISFGLPKAMHELLRRNETLYQSLILEAGSMLVNHIETFRH